MTEHALPPVSLFRLFSRMGGWMVIIAGVFLLLFTLISHLSLQAAQRFETEGQTATATVSKKYTTTSRDSDGDVTTQHWLGFSYVTSDKQDIDTLITVGTRLYRSVEVGGTFDLLYLPSEPDRIETRPGSNRTVSRFTQGAALVFGMAWLTGFWIVARWAVAGVRARKYGQRHRVQLTEIRRTNLRINNRPRYRLIWQDPDGGQGRSMLQRKASVSALRAGDTVDIYQGIKSSWWIGDVGERDR
ncbi:MAG: hypothetical protein AB8B82_14985 [Roseovarius sp.]